MAKKEILERKCRKCGGRASYHNGYYICLCGYEEMSPNRLYAFLEENKAEILKDIQVLGADKTRDKWRLPFNAWRVIRLRWGLRQVWWCEGMSPYSRDGLPKLPAWRNDWPPEFKMKWLETYQRYLEIVKK